MGNKNTDKVSRQELRRRLRAQGVDAAEIERQVDELRARQGRPKGTPAPARRPTRRSFGPPVALDFHQRDETDRAAWQRQRPRVEAETYARLSLDDRRHRPQSHDPLKTGQARATGMTARAVGRTNAMTRWQYDEAERRRA